MPQTGVDPFDVSTWDVPEVMRPPKTQATPFIPNRSLRRRLRRGRKQPPRRPLPSQFREPAEVPKGTGQVERLDYMLRHPEADFLPPEIVLSAANSDFEGTELRKAIRFMARETDIDPANLFAEGEQIQMNGREARRVARKREQEFLERGLRSLTSQFSAQIPVMEAQNADLKLNKVTTRDAARALNAIWENLDVDDVKLDKILGTAVQVAASLGSRKDIDAFAHNLRLLREGNDEAPWVYQVAAVESLGGYKAATVLDIYDRTGMAGLDRAELREQAFKTSIAEHGLHTWYDAKGERHQYVWDPFQGKWRDINSYELLAGAGPQAGFGAPAEPELNLDPATALLLAAREYTPIGVAEDLIAQKRAKVHERPDPPFMWADPETAAPNQSMLAGLIGGGDLKFKGGRVKDYYAEARKLARDLEMKEYAYEASIAGRIFTTTIETLDYAWRHVEGGLVRATTALSAPLFAGAAAVTPGTEFMDWWDEMHATAGEIEAGRTTIGMEAFGNLGLPEWAGVLALDLPAAFALDPLIWIGRAARLAKAPYLPDEFLLSGKRVSYMGRGLEWMSERNRIFKSFRPVGQWLQKGETFPQFSTRMANRFGSGGRAVARRIWDAGRRFDERVGLPLSGMYESRGEALAKFSDWYFNKPKKYLGGKTLSGFMVDHRLANPDVDLYSVLNERMKGLYNREAFHPELTRSVEQIVDVAKKGGLHRDQMILTTDELLRAGLGMKQLDPATLERLIVDPSTLGGPVDDLGFAPMVRNSVGDPKWTNRPGHVRPREAAIPDADLALEFRDYDAAFAREVLDEVSLRFGATGVRGEAGFRPLQLEFPRPARARRMVSALRRSDFGETRLGRLVDAAVAGRVPEAMVQFEAGKFPTGVERRLRRSRVFSREEQAEELAKARRISEITHPNREKFMVNYLEALSRRTWNRIAGEYGLNPEQGAVLFREFTERTDQVNFDMSKEAFRVKATRLEDGTIEFEMLGRPLTEGQLVNQWFVQDPLAMRRGIREAIGTWKATEAFVQNVARDFRAIGRQIDPEVGASLERAVFHDQLDDSLGALGWTVPQRQWARDVWDAAAGSALRNRPDLYETADDFFKSVGIKHAEEFSGATPRGALFQMGAVDESDDLGIWDLLSRQVDDTGKPGIGLEPPMGGYETLYTFRGEKGETLGILGINVTDRSVHVAVSPAARRQGIGRRLIVKAVEDNAVTPDLLMAQVKTKMGAKLQEGLLRQQAEGLLAQVKAGQVRGVFEPVGEYDGVITLFQTGDVGTFVHETGHFLRRILPDDDIAALERHFGARFDDSVEAEERFAQALETYLVTKTAPPAISSALRGIWDFLRGVWRKIRGSDEVLGQKIDPELRKVFDEWLPPEELDSFPKALSDGEISEKVLTTYAKRLGSWVANDVYLRVWKPAMVLRFGYITRVPGFDEQVRFLIDAGVTARVRSQGIVGSVAERLADRGYLPKGWVEEKTLIPTATGESVEVVRRIPGALPDEAYANSTIRAEEVYQTTAQQIKAVVRGAEKRYWGAVAPEAAEWGAAWDTAVNGHFGATITGQRALRHVANQTDKNQAIADLIEWATNDPMGRRVAKRIVPTDEIPEWAEELYTTVRRYTVNDPNLAAAALVREARPEMIDEALRGFTDPAQARTAAREGAQRELTALSEGRIEESATALRTHIKANGGATWDPVTGKFYEGKGYAVAYREGTVVRAPEEVLDDPEQFRKVLDQAKAKFGSDLESYDGLYFGAWVDDGVLHLDPSEVVKDFNEAMGLGILRRQDAITNMETFDDVPVFGRPTVHGLRAENITGERVNPIRPIVDFASRWILQIPTNRLSRQPFFKHWYDRILELQLEMAKTAKVLPSNPAAAERMVAGFRANARRFAIDRVHRVMFNFRDQSRLSEAMNFIVPFMQPFQEAFSVYSNLLRKNPAAVGYINLAFRTAANTGFIKRNPDTGEWEIPLSNWFFMAPLMSMFSGWPGMSMSAPLGAFNLFFNNAFPISGGKLFGDVSIPMPGLSPPATWLIQQFKDNDDSRLATWLYQYGDVGAKSILPFPYWLQHGITSVVPSWNQDAFTAYTDDFLKLQQYMGVTYDNKQEAIEAAEAQAKTFFRYKSIISFLFPASPRIEFGFKHLEDKYRALVEKHEGNTALARDEFLADHPKQWLIATAKTVWEREDPNLPGGQGTPSIPSTEIAEKVLAQPGLKEFAQEFPAMAWAILPQEAFTTGEYSPDVFRKQLAGADRRYLAPEEFYARGESQAGWVAYWHLREWLDGRKEVMREGSVQENDPEWIQAQDDFEDKLANLRRMYPSFGDEYGDIEEQSIDPRVLAYNRELLKSEVFMDFPVGKGLKEYMGLRDDLKAEMAKAGISSIDTVSAIDSGIAKRYEDGVAEIIEKYPDFQRAYDVFFRGVDLTRVRSEAAVKFDRYLKGLPEEKREAIYDWQSAMNDFEEQIDLAPDEIARAPIYEQQAAHINAAYENFPEKGNPAIQWYEHQSYDSKQDIRNRALTKSFLFLNRFEREYILGIETDAAAEQIWQTINATRSEISLRGKMVPDFPTGAAYEKLNVWVAQQAAANPVFASHLDRANTWGWAFFDQSELMQQDGPSGDAWVALAESVRNYQTAVEQADIHGVGQDEAAYNAVRQQLIEYVGILKNWSATFGEQWDHLESGSTGDLIDTFMPPVWFRLGG